MDLNGLTKKILDGGQISKREALAAYGAPLEELCCAADGIRRRFCGDKFDVCSIVNAKSGSCSENCKFCAQSAHSKTLSETYPLLSSGEIIKRAVSDYSRGVMRFSIVTSGRRLSDVEVDKMCETVRCIRQNTGVSVCVSFGLLGAAQFKKLKDAGVFRVHNNLETSRGYFANVCTTHTFDDKLNAVRAAQSAGLEVCSGGIMGLGETAEDRVDLAFALRSLGILSVPVNILNPIAGTPYENNKTLTNEDMLRIVAVYRLILPSAFIRLAGGRGLLNDKGESCLTSGANAAITGDMLTTAGITIETDMALIKRLGYVTVNLNG